jgi:hypothetical protein
MSLASDESNQVAQRSSAPNYAARRMLLSTIGITAVVALALGGWQLTHSDGAEVASADADFDEIVLIDRATGAITTVDEKGQLVRTEIGLGRVTATYSQGNRLALVGSQQIVLTSVDGTQPIVIPIGREATVTRLAIEGALQLVVGDASGGDVTILDGLTGAVLDVGALAGQAAPKLYADTVRHDSSGTRFAVADAAFFQTILVEAGSIAATYYPDIPVAVGASIVATSQVVGQRTEIGLFDATGKSLTAVPTAIPAGGLFVDDELLLVSTQGAVFRFGPDDEQADEIGAVEVPGGGTIRWVQPTLGGERLVVFGDTFEAVIELDGSTVFTTDFTAPVEVAKPDPGWRCLVVGGAGQSLISLESGKVEADLAGLTVTGVSADGCTVIGERAGITEVIGVDGSVRLGQVRNAVLAPDGRTVVQQTNAAKTELLRINDDLELEDPIDLTSSPTSTLLVAFLDR